jgi:hypothetical protein
MSHLIQKFTLSDGVNDFEVTYNDVVELTSSDGTVALDASVAGTIDITSTAATDTNFFEDNLVQNANRTHNQASFDTTINNVSAFTLVGTDASSTFTSHNNAGGGVAITGAVTAASTNTVLPALRVQRESSAAPAAGIGVRAEYFVDGSAGTPVAACNLDVVLSDVTATDPIGTYAIYLPSGLGTTLFENFFINGATGQVRLSGYGAGALIQSNPPYLLGVTAGSEVIEVELCAEVDDCLGIGGEGASPDLFLNQDGNWIDPIEQAAKIVERSYSHLGQGLAGQFYAGGYYQAAATDYNLNQGDDDTTIGTTNGAYGAHVFIVAAAAGTASGGTGTADITISGTSVDDDGVRTPADTEVIVADVTTIATNEYYQTARRWVGQVEITLAPTVDHTSYAVDFNAGFAFYESMVNSHLTKFTIDGYAGFSDTGFNIEVITHNESGGTPLWTYSAAAFVPGLAAGYLSLQDEYNTEYETFAGEYIGWRRLIAPIADEDRGYFFRITQGGSHIGEGPTTHINFNVVITQEPIIII